MSHIVHPVLTFDSFMQFSHAAELVDYDKMNEDDERRWTDMIANAKSLGATEEEIHQIYGEYERTPNIYDRQAEWVGGSQGVENPHFIDMR